VDDATLGWRVVRRVPGLCTRFLSSLLLLVLTAAVQADPGEDLLEARVLTESRQYPAAIALFDRLLAGDPNNSDLAIERARVLGFADRNAESATSYAAIAERHPQRRGDVIEAWAWQALWSGDAVKAEALFAEALTTRPAVANLQLGHAQALLHSGRELEAIAGFDRVLAADPASREAQVGRAYALNYAGHPRAAANQFVAVLPTTDEGIALQAARAYYWAGFPDLAVPLLAGSSLSEAQWLRDYRIERELRPYVSGSLDYSSDADSLWITSATLAGGWRRPSGNTLEASLRTTRLDGPDTSQPGSPRHEIDGRQLLLSWSGRLGTPDTEHGVAWPMVAVGVRDFDGWETFAWRARLRYAVLDNLAFTAYAGNGLLDTVGAIRNRIDYTEATGTVDYRPTSRWNLSGSLTRISYADDNDRNQVGLRAEYLLVPRRQLRVGVDSVYFENSNPAGPDHPNLGYWNPESYFEPRVYASMSGDHGPWSFDARASVGHLEEHDGWGGKTSDVTLAAEGVAAYDFSPDLQLRFYAGGSRSGAGVGSGGEGYYRSYVGISLVGYF
jgi:tetratricopeptide (TPR) repeat protein